MTAIGAGETAENYGNYSKSRTQQCLVFNQFEPNRPFASDLERRQNPAANFTETDPIPVALRPAGDR